MQPGQNETDIGKRGLLLPAGKAMHNPAMQVREDMRKDYSEPRFIGYNTLAGRLMVVVFCLPDDDHTHIISFKKANNREQKKSETQAF